MPACALCLTASFASAHPGAEAPSPEAPARGPFLGDAPRVVGGTPVAVHDGPVVGIAGPDGVFCTGTVVDPEWVLTAAHCLAADPAPVEVWWGADLRAGAAAAVAIDRGASRLHPGWMGVDDPRNDVALLKLTAPGPGPIARLADGPPRPGEVLDAFGFGDTSDGAGDAGELRTAPLEVLAVDADLVRTFSTGRNLCSGDSGAPLVWPGTDPPLVLAVGVFVDPNCLGGAGGAVRVDAVWPFLTATVPTLELSAVRREAPDSGTDPVETGDDPSPGGSDRADRGCGCRAGGSSGAWGTCALVLGAAMIGRRRRSGADGAPAPRQECRTAAPPIRVPRPGHR